MATYYISPTGNDTTGNGSSATPWLTLNKFLTVYLSGDILIVKNGTYDLSSGQFLSSSPTFSTGKNVTVSGESTGGVIIDGTGVTYFMSTNDAAHSVTFEDIEFQNFDYSGTSATSLFISRTTFNVTRCKFKDITIKDVNFGGGLVSNGNWNLSATGGTQTYTSCVFSNIISPAGINGVFHSSAKPVDFVLRNCSFSNANVIFRGNSTDAISVDAKNCIFSTDTAKVFASACVPTYDVTYCNTHGYTSAPTGTGVITTDPLYVDRANHNIRLRPTSPCLDAGVVI